MIVGRVDNGAGGQGISLKRPAYSGKGSSREAVVCAGSG